MKKIMLLLGILASIQMSYVHGQTPFTVVGVDSMTQNTIQKWYELSKIYGIAGKIYLNDDSYLRFNGDTSLTLEMEKRQVKDSLLTLKYFKQMRFSMTVGTNGKIIRNNCSYSYYSSENNDSLQRIFYNQPIKFIEKFLDDKENKFFDEKQLQVVKKEIQQYNRKVSIFVKKLKSLSNKPEETFWFKKGQKYEKYHVSHMFLLNDSNFISPSIMFKDMKNTNWLDDIINSNNVYVESNILKEFNEFFSQFLSQIEQSNKYYLIYNQSFWVSENFVFKSYKELQFRSKQTRGYGGVISLSYQGLSQIKDGNMMEIIIALLTKKEAFVELSFPRTIGQLINKIESEFLKKKEILYPNVPDNNSLQKKLVSKEGEVSFLSFDVSYSEFLCLLFYGKNSDKLIVLLNEMHYYNQVFGSNDPQKEIDSIQRKLEKALEILSKVGSELKTKTILEQELKRKVNQQASGLLISEDKKNFIYKTETNTFFGSVSEKEKVFLLESFSLDPNSDEDFVLVNNLINSQFIPVGGKNNKNLKKNIISNVNKLTKK